MLLILKNASVLNFNIEFNISVKKGFNNDSVLINVLIDLKDFLI